MLTGITNVFDAGAKPAGRPYFVMELMDGIPSTQYGNAIQFDTPGRLQL